MRRGGAFRPGMSWTLASVLPSGRAGAEPLKS